MGAQISHPIIVDLDGTLIHTDMLHESALWVLRDKPFDVLRIPGWLMNGKSLYKVDLATGKASEIGMIAGVDGTVRDIAAIPKAM